LDKTKIIVLLFSASVLLGVIFIPGYLRIRRLLKENRELELQMQQVQEENKRLAEEHDRLTNDPVYLEKVAREKLGIAKEGEVIYQVLPSE